MKEKGSKKSQVIGGMIIVVVIIVGFLLWQCISAFFGSGNYPLRFHKELDRFLGKGNWECVDDDAKRTSVYKESVKDSNGTYQDTDGRYKKWLIEYTDADGVVRGFWLNNLTHKVSNSKRTILSPKYISNKICFGMNLTDYMLELAADKVVEETVSTIFRPEEYANGVASINGYGMQVSFDYPGMLEKSYYKKVLDNPDIYDLRDFDPEVFLADTDVSFFISVEMSTYRLNEGQIQQINEKAEKLKDALLEKYGKLATFEIRLYHFENGQEYTSTDEKNASQMQSCFVYYGQDLSLDEMKQVTGRTENLRMEEYLKEK